MPDRRRAPIGIGPTWRLGTSTALRAAIPLVGGFEGLGRRRRALRASGHIVVTSRPFCRDARGVESCRRPTFEREAGVERLHVGEARLARHGLGRGQDRQSFLHGGDAVLGCPRRNA